MSRKSQVIMPDNSLAVIPLVGDDLADTNTREAAELVARPAKLMDELRKERDRRIQAAVWRIQRIDRDNRKGRVPKDDIATLDDYIDALADLPDNTDDPENPEWPVKPE